MQKTSLGRVLLWTVGILAAGAVGLAGGQLLRGVWPGGGAPGPPKDTAGLLEVDSVFPLVDLVDDGGVTRNTSHLLPGGGVVLFLDPECPPCGEMAHRWQDMIDKGQIEESRVVGISNRSSYRTEEYRIDERLTFSIFEDTDRVFLNRYRVAWLPLEVIVGASGRIRAASGDYEDPVDLAALGRMLES